jgi:hypothetical protein
MNVAEKFLKNSGQPLGTDHGGFLENGGRTLFNVRQTNYRLVSDTYVYTGIVYMRYTLLCSD